MVNKNLEYYMGLHYTGEIRADRDGYAGRIRELPGCSARVDGSDTVEGLWRLLEYAKRDWIEGALGRDETIPEPLHLMGLPEELWDHPEVGPDLVEEMLYDSGVQDWPYIPDLAQVWLEHLRNRGLLEVDPATGVVPKETNARRPAKRAPEGDLRSVPVGNKGQCLWLKLDGPRTDHGYRNIKVLDQPLRTNTAILAMLAVLEVGKKIDIRKLRKALNSLEAPLDESLAEREAEAWWGRAGEEGYEFLDNLQLHYLRFVMAMLRYHRPGFDVLAHKDQLVLIEQACEFANTLVTAARRYADFFEFGVPGQDLRETVEDAARVVRMTVLKDVEGLSNPKIGEMLGIERSKSDKIKNEHSAVAKGEKRGREILEDALGKDGYREWVEAAKAEMCHWDSFTDEEKNRQFYADKLGVSVEEARERWEEARRRGQRVFLIRDPEDTF